jgi:natural product biosynthesis luciferase-like monooxygenase protein
VLSDECGDVLDASFSPVRQGLPTPAFIQYTSGSTRTPRGVVVTHGNLLANCEYIRQPPSTKIVSWLPLFHDFGLVYSVLQPIYSAIECVLMAPSTFLQRPVRWLEAISRFRGTHAPAPNFAYDLCVRAITEEQKSGLDLSCWSSAINAAEPVRKSTMDRFLAAFACTGVKPTVFLPAYGLAESTLLVTRHDEAQPLCVAHVRTSDLLQQRVVVAPAEDRETTRALVGSGVFHSDTQVSIVDPESREPCPAGKVGEIWVAGPSVAAGYWGREDETKKTFGAHLAAGAGPFLRTGDLGFLHDGQLFVVGRSKDVVILRGSNYPPQDIEATVESSAGAIIPNAVAAFGQEVDGEERLVVVAEIDGRAGRRVDSAEVAAAVRRAVSATHEITVHAVVLIEPRTIPKTTSGKIQRSACRSAYESGQLAVVLADVLGTGHADLRPPPASPAAVPERPVDPSGIESELMSLVTRLFRRSTPPRFTATDVLSAIGLDSVMAAELAAEVLHRYQTKLSPAALFEMSARQLASEISSAASRGRTEAGTTTELLVVPACRDDQSRAPSAPQVVRSRTSDFEFGLFYFANASPGGADSYRLILDTAQAADRLGFQAVWLPERHFHAFGGVCPNPAVLAAAVAQLTSRVRIRAGSVILPLHSPIRVAEEWALVDNLSGGRVDVAFGTGWNANDFVLAPNDYEGRRKLTFSRIEVVHGLWRGGAVKGPNGAGVETTFQTFPRPVQPQLPTWLTCTGGVEGFIEAGAHGYNVLTALLFQSVEELTTKISLYRASRARNGHDPDGGVVTLMLHTYVADDMDDVRRKVRGPFIRYLESSVSLWQQKEKALADLNAADREVTLNFAFERYFQSAALFGTPRTCAQKIEQLRAIGVSEVASLVDFGIDAPSVLAGIRSLDQVRRQFQISRPARVAT